MPRKIRIGGRLVRSVDEKGKGTGSGKFKFLKNAPDGNTLAIGNQGIKKKPKKGTRDNMIIQPGELQFLKKIPKKG